MINRQTIHFSQFLIIGFLMFFLLNACSSSDDSEFNSVENVFSGSIFYTDGTQNVSNEHGSVEVVKIDENVYSFVFSDDIPEITNVEFDRNETTILNIGATETQLIRVTQSSLQIIWSEGEQSWEAICHTF